MATPTAVVRERILQGYRKVGSDGGAKVAGETVKAPPADFLDDLADLTGATHLYSQTFPGADEYIIKSGQPDIDISSIMHEVEDWPEEDRQFIPEVDSHYMWQHEVLYPCVSGLINKMKMLTVGATGTGKTTFHENLAGMLRQPFYRLGGRGDMESDTILGRQDIQDGTMDFLLGEFTKAYIRGYYVLLDEAWKLPANINMTFQRVLERNGLLQIDDARGDLKDKQFHAHDCTIIQLADNVVGTGDGADKYAATMIQDGSTINRMDMVLHLDYLKHDDEVAMLLNRFGDFLPEHIAKKVVQVAGLVRNGFQQDEVSATMSPRNLFTWMEMAKKVRSYPKAFEWTMLQRYADDTERAAISGIYSSVFGQELSNS